MKRLLVVLLVLAGVGAFALPAAAAGRHDSAGAPIALPPEVMSSLEAVAAASVAPMPASDIGGPVSEPDARLADAVLGLARSVDSIPPSEERAFAVFVGIQSELLRRELVSRMRTARLAEDGPLASALRELTAAKLAWLERSPHAGADGPDMRCHIELVQCLAWCQNMPTFMLRAACGFDCESDYLRCTGIAGVIKDLFPGPQGTLLPR